MTGEHGVQRHQCSLRPGRAVVVGTGMQTRISKIASMIKRRPRTDPLQIAGRTGQDTALWHSFWL